MEDLIDEDEDNLRDILRLHIVQGRVLNQRDFVLGLSLVSAFDGNELKIKRDTSDDDDFDNDDGRFFFDPDTHVALRVRNSEVRVFVIGSTCV